MSITHLSYHFYTWAITEFKEKYQYEKRGWIKIDYPRSPSFLFVCPCHQPTGSSCNASGRYYVNQAIYCSAAICFSLYISPCEMVDHHTREITSKFIAIAGLPSQPVLHRFSYRIPMVSRAQENRECMFYPIHTWKDILFTTLTTATYFNAHDDLCLKSGFLPLFCWLLSL